MYLFSRKVQHCAQRVKLPSKIGGKCTWRTVYQRLLVGLYLAKHIATSSEIVHPQLSASS